MARDRRNEFNRQHARILAEAAEKTALITKLSQEQAQAITSATAASEERALAATRMAKSLSAALETERARTAQLEHEADLNVASITQLTTRVAELEARLSATQPEIAAMEARHATDFIRLETEREQTLAKLELKHNQELAEVRAAITEMRGLAARIEERGRKKEQLAADAILNRKVLGEFGVPDRSYR